MYGVTKSRHKCKIAIQHNLFHSFHSSSSNIQCYYKTLGLVRNASDKDIRTAYIQMAKKYHPDINTELNSTQKFSFINEAYSILSDKSKKHKYDSDIGNHNRAHSHSDPYPNTSNKNGKNWWDFNFYGTNQQSTTDNYSDFEFGRDFYGDFSRFSSNTNTQKNRKRKRDTNSDTQFDRNSNPYADYYYYYQQQSSKNNQSKNSENIWTDFEFEFGVETEFDSEFNNEAFWKFLRNNNKKHRAKKSDNQSINDTPKPKNSENPKQKQYKSKEKHSNQKNKENSQKNTNAKEKDTFAAKDSNSKNTKFKNKNEVSLNDIELSLDLDFLEASLGCTKNINFERNEICNHCGGTSFESNIEQSKCLKCDGKGNIYGYGHDFVSHKCINCNGRGYILKNCTNCHGKAVIHVRKALTITIPSGIRDSDRVRVSKQGHQYSAYNHYNDRHTIKYGHVWINCAIHKHEHFVRVANDIHITMNIPYVLAVLGGSFVVPSIYGPNIVKILPGINSNDYECLEGHGVYDSSTNKKGNMFVHFVIHIPESGELSTAQKRLLNEYAKLEKAPFVVETRNKQNLRHFRKYGQKVQTYTCKEEEEESGSSNEEGEESENEFEDSDKEDESADDLHKSFVKKKRAVGNEYYAYSEGSLNGQGSDIDDDLDDLL